MLDLDARLREASGCLEIEMAENLVPDFSRYLTDSTLIGGVALDLRQVCAIWDCDAGMGQSPRPMTEELDDAVLWHSL